MKFNDHRPFLSQERRAAAAQVRHRWPSAPQQSAPCQYQNIVVTKHKDDLRLFINGNIQFSSSDEYRYHESLVHVPMSVSKSKSKILILGGGDGLAVREVLKYEDVENITLVDLDEDMVELCRNNKNIVDINKGALTSSKLNVVYNDAFKYLQDSNDLFDVILIDLPDPNDENLNKNMNLDINGERNDENIQMLRAIRTIVNGERGKFIDKIITMYNDGIFDD